MARKKVLHLGRVVRKASERARALKGSRELLRAAEREVVRLNGELHGQRVAIAQDDYVRQLQGELRALEEKVEEARVKDSARTEELVFEVSRLSKHRDILIEMLAHIPKP
jgi:predicted  nucleic acid-binding Zn-ribbon protein